LGVSTVVTVVVVVVVVGAAAGVSSISISKPATLLNIRTAMTPKRM
jgi:hypothetical protein